MSNMTLFHGSPFLFDKFDLSGGAKAPAGISYNHHGSLWTP